MKDGLYTRHEVACIIADLLGGTCACDYSGNDEWLPYYCEFSDNVCPNVDGVACWEQYLMRKGERKEPIFSHNLSDTLSVFHCECGNTIKVSHDAGIMNNNNAANYCSKCGCRLDWEEEDV